MALVEGESRRLLGLTVEPVLLFDWMISIIQGVAVQNLILQKTCSPAGPPGINWTCPDSGSIATAADVNTLRTTLKTCLPALTVVLAGAWREKTGLTRPLMLLGMAGETASACIGLLGSIFWSEASPWLLAALEGAVSLSGANTLVNLAATCHIADRTSLQERTNRLNFLMVSCLLGAAIATGCSGYLMSALNYRNFFLLLLGLNIFNMCQVLVFIQDQPRRDTRGVGLLNLAKLKVVFNSRPNNLVVWTFLLTQVIVLACYSGELNIFAYFLEEGFNFTVTHVGVFTSYRAVVSILGPLVFVPVSTKVFKWSDSTMAIVTGIISIVTSTCMALANSELFLTIVSLIDWSRMVFVTVTKSLMSKFLKENELGIFFSISSIGEALVPLLSLPVYDAVFKATVESLPGAFYFLTTGINVIVLIAVSLAIIFKNKSEDCDVEKQRDFAPGKKDLQNELSCDTYEKTDETSHEKN